MAKDMKECPFCGVEVKKSNFGRHVRRSHPEASDKQLKTAGLEKPGKSARKERREEEKNAETRQREKKREMRFVAVGIILIVIISVVGVIVYENLTKEGGSGGGTNQNGSKNPVAVMVTTMGTIKIELYEDSAPETAGNFIGLTENKFYDGLIFHRVVAGFVIQGGGFASDGSPKNSALLPWEDTGHKNDRYTIAMARSGDPNSADDSGSATSQFFINLVNNPSLDGYAYPYVVFGKVVEGFGVVDAIGNVPTGGTANGADWPNDPPVITSVTIER